MVEKIFVIIDGTEKALSTNANKFFGLLCIRVYYKNIFEKLIR